MGKAEIQAATEIYKTAREQADREMAELRSEIEAIREESQAMGVLKKIEFDLAQNQMFKYVVLHRVKQSKEYRKGGLTWAQFCEAVGESVRSTDQILREIQPLLPQLSAKLADFSGMEFSKIRQLGRLVSADSAEITESGVVIAGECIPLSPEYRDDLQAALETVIETNAKILADKDAEIKAKDRLLKDKQTLIERQAKELSRLEDAAAKAEMTAPEKAFLDKMDKLRIGFEGYMLQLDPERIDFGPEDARTPRMEAAYLSALGYMRMQVLAAYETAVEMYGSATTCPEEAWTQNEE